MEIDPTMSDLKLKVEMARQDQEERETEVVEGDNWEYDLQQHMTFCLKSPDHTDFIPVNALNLEHLPKDWREPIVLARVVHMGLFTVRLVVRYTSTARPDSLGFDGLKGTKALRLGTGKFTSDMFELAKTQPCPFFPNCDTNKDNHLVSTCFKIETATHVIFDKSEAEATTVEFFFDEDGDKSKVVRGHGVSVENVDVDGDQCILCCVTHDLELLDKLQKAWDEINQKYNVDISIIPEWPEDKLTQLLEEAERSRVSFSNMPVNPLAFIISHPHGCSKQISFGELVHTDVLGQEATEEVQCSEREGQSVWKLDTISKCRLHYTIPTCPGSSGAPVYVYHQTDGKNQQCVAPHSRHSKESNVNVSGLGYLLHGKPF